MTLPWALVGSHGALALLALRLERRLALTDPVLRAAAVAVLWASLALAAVGVAGAFGHADGWLPGALAASALALELAAAARWPVVRDPAATVPWTLPERAAGGLFGALLAAWAWTLAVRGSGYTFDDLTYHAAIPAWWAQTGTLGVAPLTYQATYPLNAEVVSLSLVLPVGGDAHTGLAVLVWAVLAGLGVWAVAAVSQPRVVAALAACCLLASPSVRGFARTFTANDLCLAAMALTALAAAWSPPGASSSERSGRAVLCGLAAGFALGTKVTAAPVVLALAVWWMLHDRRGFARYAAGVVALGSAWYLRNLVLTGNPVFPAEAGPFAGPLDAATQRATSIAGLLQASDQPVALLGEILRLRLAWPLPAGVLALLGFVAAGVGIARRWTSDRPVATHLLLLLVVGVAVLALFPTTPFSGTNNRPGSPPHRLVRYGVVWFGLGLALVGSWAPPRAGRPWAALPLAILLLSMLAVDRWTFGLVPVAAVMAMAGPRVPRPPTWVAPSLALAALAALVPLTGAKEARMARSMAAAGGAGPAWAHLEVLAPGARIATFSPVPGSHVFYRPAFGRRLQHRPVAVQADGTPQRRLTRTWRSDPAPWWAAFDAPAPAGPEVVAHLRAARISHVILDRHRARRWPAQREALRADPDARALVQAPTCELWALDPDPPSGPAQGRPSPSAIPR